MANNFPVFQFAMFGTTAAGFVGAAPNFPNNR